MSNNDILLALQQTGYYRLSLKPAESESTLRSTVESYISNHLLPFEWYTAPQMQGRVEL